MMVCDGRRRICPGIGVLLCGISVLCFVDRWSLSSGLALDYFYPYNTTTDQTTEKKDDGGSKQINISTTFHFFDKAYNTVFVSNNGIISFNKEFSDRYQPVSFPINGTALVAPFWADVDIEKVPGGHVWYGEYTSPEVLERASCDIRSHHPEYPNFRATWVFVSTWFNVGYYGAKGDGRNKRNTFQAVLITDASLSFVMFNYHRIEWTTGKNSEGDVTSGLGGEEAQVKVHVLAGYNAECCNRSEDVIGSATEAVINLTDSTNVHLPGRHLFQLTEPSDTETPSSTKPDEVRVSPTSGSMLGGEKLIVSGVCFPPCCSVIKAMYVEWNVTFTCRKVSWERAECVLPSVFRIGKVTLSFTQDSSLTCDRLVCGQDFNVSTSFSIYNFIRVAPKVERVEPQSWLLNRTVQFKWKASEFNNNMVEVAVLAYNSSIPAWEVLKGQYFTKVTRSTSAHMNLTIPSGYSTCIIRVAELISDQSCGWSRRLQDCAVKAIWSDIFPVSQDADFSRQWCTRWIKREQGLKKLPSPQPCPTIYNLAKNDIAHFQIDPFCDYHARSSRLTCSYVSKVKACFRLVSPVEGGDQVCCYGISGDLMSADDLYGWGTQQRYHFESSDAVPTLANFQEDVLPAFHCRYVNQDDSYLRQAYESFRPKSTTKGYLPPKPAQCAGDPHLVTLDGKKYTFNGVGEFIFTQDTEKKCVIQIRTTQAKDIDNNKQNASIIDAVVMGGEGKKQIQVERTSQGGQQVQVLVDGVKLDLHSGQDLHINGLSLSVKKQGPGVSSVLVVFDKEGLSVEIEPTPYLLNVLLIVGSKLKGKLKGLLGNFNGKAEDDFMTPDGVLLDAELSDQDIHEKFGPSWAITQEESLFTYPDGMGTANFTDLTFRPFYLDDLKGQFSQDIIEFCGMESPECLFDYETTRNQEIASQTKKFVKFFENIVNETQPVTRCDFPPDVENATKNFTGLKENDEVTYTCLNDTGEIHVLKCLGNGSWSSDSVVCYRKVKDEDKTEIPLEIIIGVVSAGGAVVLLSIITVVSVILCRRKNKKRQEAPESIDLPEIHPFTMFNKAFLQQLQKITEDGSFKIPRPFLEDPKLYEEYF